MKNHELSQTFDLIADLLEIKGEVVYKVLAYRRAAESLRELGRDAEDLWKEGQLTEIPGVGKAIAEKMDELLSTGKLEFLEKLRAEVPASLVELLQVPDIGPKKASMFWKKANIASLSDLEAAARAGKLRDLPGMGEKSEARILAGIEALGRRTTRTPLGQAWLFAQKILEFVRSLPGVEGAEAAGSLRRMRSTVGDLDLMARAVDPVPVLEAFIHHPEVTQIVGQGDTKASVEFNGRLRAQLWVRTPDRWGTALLYATGSKDHNVRLREMAQKRGLSLSDQSFLREDGSEILCATEAEVYQMLGMPWIAPELREDRGEIQAALANQLPRLLETSDLVAELHSHTTWSDGGFSIREMAEAARARGRKVLAITDHSGSLGVAGGLMAEDLKRQRVEIDLVQSQLGDSIRLLQGAEVEIKADGSLDYPDEVLASLDFVIASLHTGLRQPREQVTQRLLHAIRNPHVDLIGHPTGRLIPEREGADLDMDAILTVAAESGVALEINANPARLDLDDIYARRAMEMGIPISVNTDAHSPSNIDLAMFGVAVARRAWIGPQHTINAWQPPDLLAWLAKRGG